MKTYVGGRAWLAVGLAALVLGLTGCGDDENTSDISDKPDAASAGPDAGPAMALDCKVVVIGGGAGGLHTAFRLAPTVKDGVCLFEKESELGGRIHDVPKDAADPQSPRFGTGARRVMVGQTVLFNLAKELALDLDTPTLTQDLINARGKFSFGKDDFIPLYGGVTVQADKETRLFNELRMGSERAKITEYSDLRAYIRKISGDEEFNFLRDMSRFRADFEYPLDARGYMDYLDEEWDTCCDASYPVGGMSAFIRGMEGKATAAGARFFKGEPVVAIRKAGARYVVTTSKHTVTTDKVVIAVPPVAFDHITGDVAERIQAQAQYQEIIGVRVVTITQWWPSDWWTQIRNPGAAKDAQVWRAWTTNHCINFIEIPLEAYGIAQKATRSVYDDDLNCVLFWEELARQGNAAVEAEIQKGLEYMFNNGGVSTPATVTIPKPLKTHVQVWPAAWHWLRAGAKHTNAQIFDWAVEPLAGEPVGLVGEAYHPQRSGWSDAAYKSSIHLLKLKYGLDEPVPPSGKPVAPPKQRRQRSDGGH